MRYRLRTLVILLTIVPPLAWVGWTMYAQWQAEQARQRLLREASLHLLLTGGQPAPTELRSASEKTSPQPE